MDIVSHALWATAAAQAAKTLPPPRERLRVHVGWTAFWGAFPDLFAFSISVTWIVANRLLSGTPITPWPPSAQPQTQWAYSLAEQLYRTSHSLVVVCVVFALAWLLSKRPRWELLAWPLHLLMDIPTHSAEFYPTPILWPLSSWSYDGTPWTHPGILVPNLLLLSVTCSILAIQAWRRRAATRKKSRTGAAL